MMSAPIRPGYWFARKRFGYGAVPATWQGWLSMAVYLAAVALLAWQLPGDTLRIAMLTPVTLAYIYLVWTKTDGGFGWRWGGRD